MDKLVIQGGRPLSGEVEVSGSKNAALALMAAALLPASGKTIIQRVPDLRDVHTLANLLRIIGARPSEHRMTRIAFGRLGVAWRDEGDDIVVPAEQELCIRNDVHNAIPKIDSSPWPGFNPDLISIAI
ncbi:MAG: hypothetical protein ACK424_11060, partial [Candidatus Thermochlorobacter sp.]